MHMDYMNKTRSTFRIDEIRAEDLNDTDVAMLDGRWREIADVSFDDGDWDVARAYYSSASVHHIIGNEGDDGPVGQVLIRYLLTGNVKSGGIDDAFVLLDRVELVQVQVCI